MSNILYSIIICTKDRPELSGVLGSFVKQVLNHSTFRVEVLVIDSSFKKKSKGIVYAYKKAIKNLRYYYSEKRGVSFARNIGIKKSRGTYICFVDDDIELFEDWLSSLHSFIQSHKHVQIVFGEIYPLQRDTKRKETWIDRIHAITPWVITSVSKKSGGTIEPYSANVCIRRDVFLQIGIFNELFGSVEGPTPLPYGEDAEFFERARRGNIRTLFCEKMKVWHLLDKKRWYAPYIFWRYVDHGKNMLLFYVLERKTNKLSIFDLIKYLARSIIEDKSLLLKQFPLGIWYLLGKNIGSIVMGVNLVTHYDFYRPFLAPPSSFLKDQQTSLID